VQTYRNKAVSMTVECILSCCMWSVIKLRIRVRGVYTSHRSMHVLVICQVHNIPLKARLASTKAACCLWGRSSAVLWLCGSGKLHVPAAQTSYINKSTSQHQLALTYDPLMNHILDISMHSAPLE